MIKYTLSLVIIASLFIAACNSSNTSDIERGYTDVFETSPGGVTNTKAYYDMGFGSCATNCIAVYHSDTTTGGQGIAIMSGNNYVKIFRTDSSSNYTIRKWNGTTLCTGSLPSASFGVPDTTTVAPLYRITIGAGGGCSIGSGNIDAQPY